MIWVMGQTLSESAEDTKLGGVADAPEGRAAVPRDLNGLEKWADGNLVKISNGKGKVLRLGRDNRVHQYRLGRTCWRAALQKRTWGTWWTSS